MAESLGRDRKLFSNMDGKPRAEGRLATALLCAIFALGGCVAVQQNDLDAIRQDLNALRRDVAGQAKANMEARILTERLAKLEKEQLPKLEQDQRDVRTRSESALRDSEAARKEGEAFRSMLNKRLEELATEIRFVQGKLEENANALRGVGARLDEINQELQLQRRQVQALNQQAQAGGLEWEVLRQQVQALEQQVRTLRQGAQPASVPVEQTPQKPESLPEPKK
jgi:chromosome segregation ATPase